MNTKDILLQLRTQKGLSQEQLAEQVFVTRQAVSRWETGETTPNTETLKLLSRLYDVSINTLLGSPQQLICQCCGMPLEDATTSREPTMAFRKPPSSAVFQFFPGTLVIISHEMEPIPLTNIVQMMDTTTARTRATATHISPMTTFSSMNLLLSLAIISSFSALYTL